MEAIVTLLTLIGLVFLAGLAYKGRYVIARWLNEAYQPHANVPDRKTILKRRIEDSQTELDHIDKFDNK